MRGKNIFQFRVKFLYLSCFLLFVVFLIHSSHKVKAQSAGSVINGMIFDQSRNGATDVDVELLDEFSRLIARTRTTGGGRFTFRGLAAGVYVVRVMPGRFGYREQTQQVQLVSMSRGQGNDSTSDQAYVDFTLQSARAASFAQALGVETSVFVQDVPSKALEFYNKAEADFNQKRVDSGVGNLKSAIESFPVYYLALNRLGEEYIKLQDFKSAGEILAKAVEVNPKAADSFYMLGYSQYILKQYGLAIKSLRESITWSPKSSAAYLLLGMSLRQTAEYMEAETQMLKAKKLTKKKSSDIHWQLALLYGNNLKRYGDAANELELFLKTQPDSKDAEPIKKLIKQFRDKALQAG